VALAFSLEILLALIARTRLRASLWMVSALAVKSTRSPGWSTGQAAFAALFDLDFITITCFPIASHFQETIGNHGQTKEVKCLEIQQKESTGRHQPTPDRVYESTALTS
jgi:hypothetical protein